MKNTRSKQLIILFLLILVPVLYVFMGFYFHSERTLYYMYSVDPEYCYLFNGLNISQFTLKVWHVDHPGTPTQLLAALVIRVVHLFHGNGPLLKDVMQNSALYAYAINITMFFINSIALFILGCVAYKHTKSIIQSIFLQFTPFASYLVLSLVYRINPENMAIFCFVLMAILLLKYFQLEEPSEKIKNRYLIAFAAVVGFTMAVKITFLPVMFFPMFLFKGFWRKIKYGIVTGLAFLICIIPVLYYRFSYFYGWIKSLFIHSGRYGGGKANIIDKNEYMNALRQTFSFDNVFTVSFFLFVLALIVYHIPYIKSRVRNVKYYNALLGIVLGMSAMILLVAKQFNYHYLTPALLPVLFGVWIVVNIYLGRIKNIYRNLIFIPIILVFLSFDYGKISEFHPYNTKMKEALNKTSDYINQHPSDKALVIVPTYYGCPYQQYSLYFGLFWGGEIMRPKYVEVLKEVYPNTYIYNGWDELFHDWNNDPFSYGDILKKHNDIRLYMGDSVIENDILKPVMYNIHTIGNPVVTKIFSNNFTHENLYEISYDPSKVPADSLSITCDAETADADSIHFDGSSGQLFRDAVTRSSEKQFSGKYSSRLTGEHQYGMTYTIGQVKKGEHYKVSIWRNNENMNAQLVISARNGDDFYMWEKKTVNDSNGWGEITIDVVIPEKMDNKELRIYAFNDTGSPAFFDDLKITVYFLK